jgi:hypothetical protein
MSQRTSWEDIKTRRAQSPARQRGYEKAGRAIRVASQIRALRARKGLSQR